MSSVQKHSTADLNAGFQGHFLIDKDMRIKNASRTEIRKAVGERKQMIYPEPVSKYPVPF